MTEVRPVCCVCDQEISTDHCYRVGDQSYDCICMSCVNKALRVLPDNFIKDVISDDWYERYNITPLIWV